VEKQKSGVKVPWTAIEPHCVQRRQSSVVGMHVDPRATIHACMWLTGQPTVAADPGSWFLIEPGLEARLTADASGPLLCILCRPSWLRVFIYEYNGRVAIQSTERVIMSDLVIASIMAIAMRLIEGRCGGRRG
jgi:hypothetical protein